MLGVLLRSPKYTKICSMQHIFILTQLLYDKGSNIVTYLCSTVFTNDGVHLLDSICDFLWTLSIVSILNVLTYLGSCTQNNGEIVKSLFQSQEHIYIQIGKMGYNKMDDFKMAFTQQVFPWGAYFGCKSLKWLQGKLKNDEVTLKLYDSPHAFSKVMKKVFTNNGVYKNGEMLQLKNLEFGHTCSARGPGSLALAVANFCFNILPSTQEDIDAIMAQTNCVICCLSPSHASIHYMDK